MISSSHHPRAHRTDLDDGAGDREYQVFLDPAAADRQRDLGVGGAAHLFDRLLQRQPEDRLVVEMGHQVAGLDACALGRRVVDGGDHLDEALLHRDLDAEAAELAAGLDLDFLVALGVVVLRMRVERGDHAFDGCLDQLRRAHVLDVAVADTLQDVAEQIELIVCLPVFLGDHDCRMGDRHQADKDGYQYSSHSIPRPWRRVPNIGPARLRGPRRGCHRRRLSASAGQAPSRRAALRGSP